MRLGDNMLKVSKTGFLNLIRCKRFAALESLYRDKEQAIVSFSNKLEELESSENAYRKSALLVEMYDEAEDGTVENLLVLDDAQLKLMMPYYNKIEMLSAKAIKNKFKGTLSFSKDTFKQKRFSMDYKGYQFYCFLDGYLEGDDIRVFETKATTSNKFIKVGTTTESVFKKNIDGIWMLQSELGYINEKVSIHEEKLYQKYHPAGQYVYDLAYQRFVIENSKEYDHTKPHKYYLAVLNHEYIFDGHYDHNNEPVYKDDIIVFIDLTETTKKMMDQIQEDFDHVVDSLDEMNAQEVPLGIHCGRGKTRECKFFPICFNFIPEINSIFSYMGNHHGFEEADGTKHFPYDLVNGTEGTRKIHMLDIPKSWLKRKNNVIQRQVVETGQAYYNKGKIKMGIDQIKYPIYHLDFESFPCPLPRFTYEKAYSQSLFQFSLHIEHEGKEVDEIRDNISYLAPDTTDRREELIIALVDAIKPDGGSVLVYNQSFEKSRIKELGEMFPKYKDRLNDIANRLFDLMHIVKTNTKFYEALGYEENDAKAINFYTESLNGSYSIKKVLPALSDLSYADLSVKHGVEAYITYASLDPLNNEKYKRDIEGLIAYCRRDTYSMVKILNELKEIVS